ncbi:ATPase, T2SS/T4P/T4SS family [Paracraurococcus lichenis]|uniref:ATPase, T2SS/T4P/T4SS family n=1 Tax=Paracraurococcus lichenis TaxID=3064888 RepID=A0ABT9EA14_9PROT|nr:ATPase, T2SS/T4P/T4SS family [Paracraurococcus sp. LOR1-02]MDO9712808.1 ATPase, T2SS/T4P/T4SS family [Paracraurococcus sp. LOR1-02]
MMTDDRALRWLLRPVERWMTDPATTDFCMNQPGEAWVRQRGTWISVETPYDLEDLEMIGLHSAGLRRQDIWTDTPLCATTSPWGHRVQLIQRPCVLPLTYSYSARRAGDWQPTVDGLGAAGLFANTRRHDDAGRRQNAYVEPARHYREGDMPGFWKAAVHNGLTIMAGGKMGSGKTTFVRALGAEVDSAKRVCSIEDEDEARLTQPNRVGMLYSEGGQGEADVGPEKLMVAALRMAVEFAMVQELRNASAWAFLRMAATIQTFTTNHGDSCYGIFDSTRLMLKTSEGGKSMSDVDIFRLLNRYVDVVVHCEFTPPAEPSGKGTYGQDEVWFRGVDRPLGLTDEQAAT